MLKWIYLLVALLSIGEIIYYFETSQSKINKNQFTLFIFAAITNYAYALGTFSTTLEGLVLANHLYNFGSITADIFMLFVVAEICHIDIPKVAKYSIASYGAIIICLVATCKYNPLYYKSISFAKFNEVAYLRKVYGPFHVLVYGLLFGCIITAMIIVFYALKRESKISVKTALEIIIIYTVSILSYALTRIIHFPLDVIPFALVINCAIMLKILDKAKLYDMTANILNVYEQRAEYGYIAFDIKKRFMGCNEFAASLFPSLKDAPIDSNLVQKNSRMCKEILPWLDAWIQGGKHEHVTEYGGITAVCSIRYITSHKKDIGYLIEIRDVSKQQKYINILSDYSKHLEGQVENTNERLINMQYSIISGMASMVESRDNSTGEHVKRTSAEVGLFTKEIRKNEKYSYLTEEYCNDIVQSAIMHDLGKIAVDDAVLKKPGKFTPDDYDKMKQHSEEGARIVTQIMKEVDDPLFRKIAVNVAHYHHERWDGKGYPSGLKETEIPIEARIMAFADVFDALVSKRCYKEPISVEAAMEIIEENLGSQFDPDLGKIFLECRPKLEALYSISG